MIGQEKWREAALQAGFQVAGVTPPALPEADGLRLDRWLREGCQADMGWLARTAAVRRDPGRFLPPARSILMVGCNTGRPPVVLAGGGRIARYAAGRDYHRFMGRRLDRLRLSLGSLAGSTRFACRRTLDIHPVLERALAREGGLGWSGHQAMVIHPRYGPWLLLGGLFLELDLEPGPRTEGDCGRCRRCIDACPTGAIRSPGVVDSRRCLSYWSIESRDLPPAPLRERWGDRLFGCDTCLEACPHGRETPPAADPDQALHPALANLDLADLLTLGEEVFETTFRGTPLRRPGLAGLKRNAALAAGNLGDAAHRGPLETALVDPEPVVRAAAAWALGRLHAGGEALRRALRREAETSVKQEIEAALEGG